MKRYKDNVEIERERRDQKWMKRYKDNENNYGIALKENEEIERECEIERMRDTEGMKDR